MTRSIDESAIGPRDPIAGLVTGDPISVDEKLTLRSIAAVLSAADIGAALIRRDDVPVGIVSERDVVGALADDADPDTVWSADVMTEDLVTTDAETAILRVGFRMLDEGIRHIAVVRDREVVGIVSSRDVFAILAEAALKSL